MGNGKKHIGAPGEANSGSPKDAEELSKDTEELDPAEYSLEAILAEFRTEKPVAVDLRQPWVNAGEKPRPIQPGKEEKKQSRDGPNPKKNAAETEALPALKPPEKTPAAESAGAAAVGETTEQKPLKGEKGFRLKKLFLPLEEYEDSRYDEPEEQETERQEEPPDIFSDEEEEPEEELAPEEAAREYGRGLTGLRLRTALIFLLCLPMTYLILWDRLGLPMPSFLTGRVAVIVFTLLILETVCVLLAMDVMVEGLYDLLKFRPGAETAAALSAVAGMLDAATMLSMNGRNGSEPYCTISAFALGFSMWGLYLRKRGMRDACRAAAASAEPYVVQMDGEARLFKRRGTTDGFLTGVEKADGADRLFRLILPLSMVGALVFALLASVGRGAPDRFFWCWAAMMSSTAIFSGTLSYGLPFGMLARRLLQAGAALAGWSGAEAMEAGGAMTVTDGDLFPAGTVAMNGIKVFGDWPADKATAYAAALLSAAGCGLARTFEEVLRTQGGTRKRAEEFSFYESGGFSGVIQGDQALLGNADFMALMGIPLPHGMKLKHGVFLAVNGALAGVFAVNYAANDSVRSALAALLHNKIKTLLALRDFCLTPSMLTRKFRLPVARCDYPDLQCRLECSEEREENGPPAAVICREGLVPFADAVVGGRRLRFAVRANAAIACVGCVFGVLIGFYLTFVAAAEAISPANLLVYMLMWTLPTFLISGWVTRY